MLGVIGNNCSIFDVNSTITDGPGARSPSGPASVKHLLFIGDSNCYSLYNYLLQFKGTSYTIKFWETNNLPIDNEPEFCHHLLNPRLKALVEGATHVFVMTGGNWLFKNREGNVTYEKHGRKIHLTEHTNIGNDTVLDKSCRLILTVVSNLLASFKGDTRMFVLGIPPRFFHLCCDSRHHFAHDSDGEFVNVKIRNLNAFVGKHINNKYTLEHDNKVFFIDPSSYLSPRAYEGLTANGDHLLLADQIHWSGLAKDAAVKSILALIFDVSTELDFVDHNVVDLPDSFTEYSALYNPLELPKVHAPTARSLVEHPPYPGQKRPHHHGRGRGRGSQKRARR